MRLSVDKSDPGYSPQAVQMRPRVFLDGVRMERVVTADEERGEVVRYRTGPDGRMVVAADGESLEREVLVGAVRIEVDP